MVSAPLTDQQVLDRIANQQLIESVDHMSPAYLEGIKRILTVSADTELISAPAYYNPARAAPSLNPFGSALSIIQDELGHAHIAYRLMRDLGVDIDALIYERDPRKFKYPYAFDVPLETWVDLVMANAFYDRAGFVLLGDIFQTSTFGPWKRALVKVDKEETFHLRHGENWMKKLSQNPDSRREIQAAIDWMFLLTVEWFGLPDDMKKHGEQLGFGFKGKSNDQLRQIWFSTAVPLCESLNYSVPAHYDADTEQYVLDVEFPLAFDAANKRWLIDDGAITWETVLERWKARGPMNDQYVDTIQRGHRELQSLMGHG
ncbi:MAG TPA: Phenylacetic acid catabolic protein [Chloroflexota bacterium]|jgi:ring-1,2-phenylacetyl-CoA epoxidase subunit PaaA|nr:Phenylacetic acid catabolic protein [Chloroflexota bacterium]